MRNPTLRGVVVAWLAVMLAWSIEFFLQSQLDPNDYQLSAFVVGPGTGLASALTFFAILISAMRWGRRKEPETARVVMEAVVRGVAAAYGRTDDDDHDPAEIAAVIRLKDIAKAVGPVADGAG